MNNSKMSTSRQPHSQFSKTSSDPQRVIKPILQSRKKAEKKPADFRPISTQAINPKSSPARKSEKPSKDQESGLLTYKEQRDLRCRKSDVQKTEKKTLNEIEKIQNSIRKTSIVQDFSEACNEMKKIVASNSKTPSLSNHIPFSELFKNESKESGSVKDRICRQFLQKFAEKKNSLEEFKNEEEVKTYKDEKVDDEQNLSFEDPNLFMPEIPFFQYNYTNYEVLESDLSCFDLSEKLEDPEPMPGTISLMYEIFLDTEKFNLITTKTFNYEILKIPPINPVFIKDVGKITVNKTTNFVQENIQKSKPVIKILKRFTVECTKKPVSGLYYEEVLRKTVKILSNSEFVPDTKPVLSDLLIRKFELCSKFLSFSEFSLNKARVMTKPLIVLQEDHKKPRLVNQSQVESQKILLDSYASPIISQDRQLSLFESQNSFDSFQFTLSKQSSYDMPCQPFTVDHVPQTPAFSFPTTENIPFNFILAILVSKSKISQEKAAQALKKRKQESALFVLFSIKKHSALFNHFETWKNLYSARFKSDCVPDSKTIEKFLHFSASFIQRNWKGFFVRKFVVPSLAKYKLFKAKLKAVVIGWKTRKILTTRRMQGHFKTIKDLHNIIFDMNKDPAGASDSLLPRFIDELPKVHSKMIKDFNSLYRTGTWVALLKVAQSKFLDSGKFTEKTVKLKSVNRDEMPIKPLQIDYNELPAETEPVFPQPKKIFRNFLKRKSKTVTVPENLEKTVNATEEIKEKQEGNLRKEKNIMSQEHLEDIEEENMPEDKKFEGKPKEFLKRKSQSIKPKKLQWNVKRKIDCWVSKDVYIKKPQKIVNVAQKEFFNIEELETIFEESLRNFVDTSVYLKKFERIAAKTKIPQFRNCSDFLFGVKEENYYEILEELESHYLHLCTQGIRL